MADALYARLQRRITRGIKNTQARDSLDRCMVRSRDMRAEALAQMPGGDAFRDRVKQTKDQCRADQDELLARFVAKAEARGAKVFLAEDAQAAIDYTLRVARERGARTIAKSKSLTTEEIEINRPLEEAGLRVVETDLGELIIQMAGEKPFHLVFPSVHKSAKDVAAIFEKTMGHPVSANIDDLMKTVQGYLRPIFLNTDIGMTGANIGIAETGGIVIETNEGNARLVSSVGDCHICIMGREKIVGTLEDALLMAMAHPISASGQCPTTYITWMHGRSPLGEGGGRKRESHIIILDNGRSRMREDPQMREALNCIRCGACMNICPTYGVVGGHTFGYIYPGPIGIPWTAAVHGLDKAAEFAPLCISCGLCKEICPAKIDMPLMIAEVKHRAMRGHPGPRADRTMMAADRFAALGSATAPVSNWVLRSAVARRILEWLTGLDRRRRLPPFNRQTLEKRVARRKGVIRKEPQHKVAFFTDVYVNYNAPELGLAAIERLEAAGCEVILPTQRPSGYPFIAYGDLPRAREVARFNVEQLAPLVQAGYDIVSPEPTAVYALKHSYPDLLAEDSRAADVAARTFELFEYLIGIEDTPDPRPLEGRRLGFHCACHQRPLSSGRPAVEWLERLGAQVQRVETGTCCGMGGTFGLKAGALGYDLTQAVGERLFDAFKASGVEAIVTESSVCGMHLGEGTGMRVVHPLEVLASLPNTER